MAPSTTDVPVINGTVTVPDVRTIPGTNIKWSSFWSFATVVISLLAAFGVIPQSSADKAKDGINKLAPKIEDAADQVAIIKKEFEDYKKAHPPTPVNVVPDKKVPDDKPVVPPVDEQKIIDEIIKRLIPLLPEKPKPLPEPIKPVAKAIKLLDAEGKDLTSPVAAMEVFQVICSDPKAEVTWTKSSSGKNVHVAISPYGYTGYLEGGAYIDVKMIDFAARQVVEMRIQANLSPQPPPTPSPEPQPSPTPPVVTDRRLVLYIIEAPKERTEAVASILNALSDWEALSTAGHSWVRFAPSTQEPHGVAALRALTARGLKYPAIVIADLKTGEIQTCIPFPASLEALKAEMRKYSSI